MLLAGVWKAKDSVLSQGQATGSLTTQMGLSKIIIFIFTCFEEWLARVGS